MAFEVNILRVATFIILGTLITQATSRPLHETSSIAERFEQWIAQYGRIYLNSQEKEMRFGIFKENVKFVENFNNEPNKSYKLGINKYSDLTNQEFLAHHTGFSHPPNSTSSSGIKSFRYQNLTAATSIDWRSKGAVAPIKDQGSCNACWAFSSVASVEGLTKIKTGKLMSLSEQQLIDCDQANGGCTPGWMDKAYEYMKKHGGVTLEATYPFTGTKGQCDSSKASKVAANISGYEWVPKNSEIDMLKAVSNQPVTIGIDPRGQAFQHYQSGVFSGRCGTDINHAVVAVGFGKAQDGTEFWILKNSWGTSWGEKGFMRIRRNSNDPKGHCGIAQVALYPTSA